MSLLMYMLTVTNYRQSSGCSRQHSLETLDSALRSLVRYNPWWKRTRKGSLRHGMGILALKADERVAGVGFTADSFSVSLKDGRTIIVLLAWYPRLLRASSEQLRNWRVVGGGYGIHWPDLDEDVSTEGLLRGAPAPSHPPKA